MLKSRHHFTFQRFLGYSHRTGDLTRTCKADGCVNTCTVATVTDAASILDSIFDYYSTVTYTCQDC